MCFKNFSLNIFRNLEFPDSSALGNSSFVIYDCSIIYRSTIYSDSYNSKLFIYFYSIYLKTFNISLF